MERQRKGRVPGQTAQVLLGKGRCLHRSAAAKRDDCCSALEYTFEPCGFSFGQLTPTVYQIGLSSAALTARLWLVPWRLSVHHPAGCRNTGVGLQYSSTELCLQTRGN